jgi:hypothetical protein
MNVIRPETRTDVRHFSEVLFTSKKKKIDAAIIAIVPMKKVKAT